MKVKHSTSYWSFAIVVILILALFNCQGADKPAMIEARESDSVSKSESLQLETGHFMLKSPKEMEVNQSENIEVWITKDSIRDAAFFQDNLSENDSIIIEQIRVGEVMEINLIEENKSDQNFDITAHSTPQQVVDDFDAAIWKWSVRPLKAGAHKLIVIARIKMMTEDLQLIGYKDLPVVDQVINVNVADKPIDKKSEKKGFYWLVLVPVFGFLAWFLFKKKQIGQKQHIDASEFNAFETEIQNFIKKDRIKQAFTVFEAFIEKHPNEALENAVVLLKSNYTNNESRVNKSLIDNDEYNINRSKIINELLEMIDGVE